MFILVAVGAQQLPVAAVHRIVVAVMDFQRLEIAWEKSRPHRQHTPG